MYYKKNFFALTIGLGVEALINLIYLIKYMTATYAFFSWSSLLPDYLRLFAYMAFKKYSAKPVHKVDIKGKNILSQTPLNGIMWTGKCCAMIDKVFRDISGAAK